MSSLAIREARENIIQYMNNLPFPMEVKRLMFKEILSQIDSVCEQEIVMQIKERDESKKNNESNVNTESEEKEDE